MHSWPTEAEFAANGDWSGLMKYAQKQQAAKAKPKKGKKAAAAGTAAAAKSSKPDDLTKINGVGPRIETILNDGGVDTYDQLAHTSSDDLRRMMAECRRASTGKPLEVADAGQVRGQGRLAGFRRATTTASRSTPLTQVR